MSRLMHVEASFMSCQSSEFPQTRATSGDEWAGAGVSGWVGESGSERVGG
jgi:hypothetical protein